MESQTQIGPPPNYLENDFETTLTERTGANFNNHVLRMITEGQSQRALKGVKTEWVQVGANSIRFAIYAMKSNQTYQTFKIITMK